MFQIRRFPYQLIRANKNKVSSKASFTNWQISTAIFGGQISQIHGCRPNLNFNHQELVHRKQFCTGNYDISSPIDDNTNSTSPISSETTNIAKGQNEQHKIRASITDSNKLYQNYLKLVNLDRKMLKLRLRKGKNRQKFFQITIRNSDNNLHFSFSNILVPEDAYAFVRKMDELIEELTMENFDQKFIAVNDQNQSKRELIGKTVEMIGKFHKFQLELLFFQNVDKKSRQKQLCFIHVITINLANNNKIQRILLPLEGLLWLREHMVDMLERHDGTETIERDAPAKIPKEFLTDGLVLKS